MYYPAYLSWLERGPIVPWTSLFNLYSRYKNDHNSRLYILCLIDPYQWLIPSYSYFIEAGNKANKLAMKTSPANITQLLRQWQNGDQNALDALSPLVYQELHRIASHYMRRERAGHTLQTTALVNEAFAKLVDAELTIQDRSHFYRIAARQMRRILVDYARTKHRKKRGEHAVHVQVDENSIADSGTEIELLALDEALQQLKQFDQRKHDIVELFYFIGLNHKDISEVMNISPKTVQRELRLTEAWLHDALTTP